jgi:phage tail sheath protein FI
MPPTLTYPGVYIQEIPSGVRPITGVATSIAAFIGKTERGPEEMPVTITSFADFEREFGALSLQYPVGFAVRDFYENGGGIAIVVRVFNAQAGSQPAEINHGTLKLVATAPGSWAKDLRIRVETNPNAATDLADLATQLGVAATDFFNLRIRNTKAGVEEEESHLNLTFVPSARQVKGILEADSRLLRDNGSTAAPAAHTPPTTPAEEATLWTANQFSTAVTNAGNVKDSAALDGPAFETGINALDHADLFNLLVIPPDILNGDLPAGLNATAAAYCAKRRALYVVDPPSGWNTVAEAKNVNALGINGTNARYAAVYFPRVRKPNPLRGNLIEPFTASGIIAGVMARTDESRGVWKAPAGVDAGLTGVNGLEIERPMSDDENGQLNPLGVNCLRYFPIIGHVVWGARTLRGADLLGDEYKYVPVRRTANFIEESLFRGLKWVVFEPNDEPLWAQIRLNVGAFMQGLFRQGAFQGTSARDAYFVACDKTTTTQNDINLGIVNVVVGFAPLKPAEFVIVKIQQIAGQIQT